MAEWPIYPKSYIELVKKHMERPEYQKKVRKAFDNLKIPYELDENGIIKSFKFYPDFMTKKEK